MVAAKRVTHSPNQDLAKHSACRYYYPVGSITNDPQLCRVARIKFCIKESHIMMLFSQLWWPWSTEQVHTGGKKWSYRHCAKYDHECKTLKNNCSNTQLLCYQDAMGKLVAMRVEWVVGDTGCSSLCTVQCLQFRREVSMWSVHCAQWAEPERERPGIQTGPTAHHTPNQEERTKERSHTPGTNWTTSRQTS